MNRLKSRVVVIIGPSGVGKSTIGKMLARRLGLAYVSLDEIRFQYYAEIGYEEEKARLLRENAYEDLLVYWQPFDAHSVVRALAEHQNCVFDLGAIHSVYNDPALFKQVSDALAPYQNVVLLLPSPDKDESVRILHERGRAGLDYDAATLELWHRIIERFVKHPSNELLAKHIVYTAGQTPDEIVTDLIHIINMP